MLDFDFAWRRRFGDERLRAMELGALPRDNRWVRLHSLPESKRYAESEDEYRELLRRYFGALDELRGAEEVLTVVTFSFAFSTSSRPVRRTTLLAELLPRPRYWRSVSEGYAEDEEQIWAHAYVHKVHRDAPELRELYRLVADDRTGDVIVTDPDVSWVHCPYDGGADLVLQSPAERDRVSALFKEWRSPCDHGL
ncbi:hypothetical protein AXK57_19420 [Tsukamurella pulmonis]|nr:hypothetical protein AXK57_19420 [Tsukamurella pulmonis]RDH13287.1 hypothetical protein DVB88_03225 [Tsukamurella pulmonis]